MPYETIRVSHCFFAINASFRGRQYTRRENRMTVSNFFPARTARNDWGKAAGFPK